MPPERTDDLSLNAEIQALRESLRRVMTEALLADDVTAAAGPIARLADALIRAVRAQHALQPAPQDDLQAALERILAEVGLGPEEPGA